MRFKVFFWLLCCGWAAGCRPDPAARRFGVIFFYNDKEYFIETPSFTEGTVTAPPQPDDFSSAIIFGYRNGYYYGMEAEKEKLIRYRTVGNELVVEKELSYKGTPWSYYSSWHNWLDDNTLLMGTTNGDGKEFDYAVINVTDMRFLAKGKLDLPSPGPKEHYGGIFAQHRGDRLYVGYSLYEGFRSPVPAQDTTYLATIAYPSMKTLGIQKDTRSTWPGGYYLHGSFSFVNDDAIYFMTEPGGRTHNHPTARSGIYRIPAGQDLLDSTYFFPIADKQTEEAYELFPLGRGKALTKVIANRRVTQYMDYLHKHVVEYYVLDLKTRTRKKLPLPLDELEFVQNVLADGDDVYIAVNTGDEESTIWKYDLKTGTLTKGIHIPGRVYHLNRLPD